MDIKQLKLHTECHTCALFKLEKCKGKETKVPCLGYESEQEYAKKVLKGIKQGLGIKNNDLSKKPTTN